MIITRTPLRISFVGGGSDIPAFYREEPGCVVSATIDKYVYVMVNEQFEGRVLAHYRATEDVAHAGELCHDRMRACLLSAGLTEAIEITSMADVPGSTGLGSSSAFTVGLLHALRPCAIPESYATHACTIEIDTCRAPIGKQDQYAAAFGGVNMIRFLPDEQVEVKPIPCNYETLEDHLILLYTGLARQGDAGQQLAAQRLEHGGIQQLVRCARLFARHLADGDLHKCGPVLDFAWEIKRRFCSTPQIDHWYATARAAGAWGGKLCGAGGGGFLLLMAPPERHAAIIAALDLRHVPIQLTRQGSTVIYAD